MSSTMCVKLQDHLAGNDGDGVVGKFYSKLFTFLAFALAVWQNL